MIHNIIPTNVRLHRIRLTDTNKCTQCGRQDTKLNRLTKCGVRQEIWEWNRPRIAQIERTDPRRIPKEWPLRPFFKLWPPQIHQATLWFLASKGFYVVNHCRTLSVLDCNDCLKADSHIACRAHAAPMPRPCHSNAMPCVNSHTPCRAPALFQQSRVLRESPRGSRKYPNC
jgi:hypothetical protein